MRERLKEWGERAESHRGLIQILPHRLAIAAWQAAPQVIIYLIFGGNRSCFLLTCQRQGVIRLEFASDETGDKLTGVSQRTEDAGSRNMQMRSAGFKAAVCLIAAFCHCLPMMDEGFHCRGPLGVQIFWFMITHDLWLWIDVRLFKRMCGVVQTWMETKPKRFTSTLQVKGSNKDLTTVVKLLVN